MRSWDEGKTAASSEEESLHSEDLTEGELGFPGEGRGPDGFVEIQTCSKQEKENTFAV